MRVGSYIPQQQLTPQSTSPTDFSAFIQSTNKIALSGFGYDSAGNLTSHATTPANAMVYDAENRQISYTKAGVTTTYTYDGDGRRVKKVDNSGTIIFVYNVAGQLIAEYTSGTPSGGGTSYLTSDHLGSLRVLMKPDGSVGRHDYLPFGEEISSTIGGRGSVAGYGAPDSTRQRFTQKERDNESGLDYFLARYYSSALGRFTSPDEFKGGPDEFWAAANDDGGKQALPYADIANPQSLNKYQYAFDNPLRYLDPDGHQSGEDPLSKLIRWLSLYTFTPHPDGGREAILDQRIPGQDGMTLRDMHQIQRGAVEEARKNLDSVLSLVDPTGIIHPVFKSLSEGDPGPVAQAAVGFSLSKLFGAGFQLGKLIVGRLGAAKAVAEFSTQGGTFVASILGANSGRTGLSTVSFTGQLLDSITAHAREQGFSQVTINAVGVTNETLRKKLIEAGFKETTVTIAGQKLKGYTATFRVQ